MSQCFNPEECSEVLERFSECPSTLALFSYGLEKGHRGVFCVDLKGKEKVFYVPQHRSGIKRCNLDNSVYTFTGVTEKQFGPPQFWLVVCASSRLGYLFPIDSFDDEGNYHPPFVPATAGSV